MLYSDQVIEENKKVDDELLKLLDKENASIGYIPSASESSRKYYNQKVEYYRKLGINNLQYFDIDEEYNEYEFNKIFNYDAIHLSGGNTFNFLHLLRKRDLLGSLNKYVYNGGILIGVSAGSILTTKTIEIARFCDENHVGITNYNALGIIDFEFMPHWNENAKYYGLLKEYSVSKSTTIYACKDGDGIVVNGEEIKFIGDIVKM